MTCDEFDGVVVDLARGQAEETSATAEALAHASRCEACRSLLEEQRLLSRRLQTLSEETSRSETPVAVSMALRAAFRQQGARVEHPPSRRERKPSVAWVWPVAAAVLIGFALAVWHGAGPRVDPEEVASAPPPSIATTRSPAASSTAAVESRAEDPRPEAARTGVAPVPRARRPRETRVPEPRAVFVPLLPGDRLDNLGPGRLVRVGLSRAALVSWGWPLEGDVAAEMVEADVLVGEDGVARAIRVAN